MRITSEEYLAFYTYNSIPNRFGSIHNSLVQYALFVDSLKCWCKINRKNLKTVEGRQYFLNLCNLFLQRGYLLYILENKEVVNMVLEQMTREDIAKQEGWVEGWVEGKEEGKKEGKEEGIFAMISFLHEMNVSPDKTLEEIQTRFQLSKEEVTFYLNSYMEQHQKQI